MAELAHPNRRPACPRSGEPVSVYISATAACVDHVREAAAKIRAAGHQVVSTWHDESEEDDADIAHPGDARRVGRLLAAPAAPDRSDQAARAIRCVAELEQSNMLLWIVGNNDFPDCGEDLWEVGWAFARGLVLGRISVARHPRSDANYAALVLEYKSVEAWLTMEAWLKGEAKHG